MIKRFLKADSAATAIEYSIIASGIAVAIMAAIFAFGDQMVALFDGMTDVISG